MTPPPFPVMLRTLADLLIYWSAKTPADISRHAAALTYCQALVQLQTPDGAWHEPNAMSRETTIRAFAISSAAVSEHRIFELPVFVSAVDRWIEHLEAEVDRRRNV
jgi:hypothetical protein